MATEQLGVLKALDVAKTQWYHFTAIVIAGMGFFTDAYDLFSISLVTSLLGRLYYSDRHPDSHMPTDISATVTAAALWGTLVGQLFFGWLGDVMGRKKVYGITLTIMVVSSIASGLTFGDKVGGHMATLCFFRFWLGFGIGGDYPLSATIMSEYANKRTRGAFMAAVFAMQGFGVLASGIVTMIVSAAFDRKHIPHPDYVWRIILMFGAVPAALTFYWRMKMPETARYTALIAKNAQQAAADMSRVLQVDLETEEEKDEKIIETPRNKFGLFSKEFAKRHGLHLLGTTTTWFVLDIAFYSLPLYQDDIFTAMGWMTPPKETNAMHEVYKSAKRRTLIALCSIVPGYWFTVAFIDHTGRLAIQLMGFFFISVFMFVLAIPYDHWQLEENRYGFLLISSLTLFFSNFGPNTTTFIIPAEIFPARLRSTCHGISAAAGKAGAIVGTFAYYHCKRIGIRKTLIVHAAINLFGMVLTLLLPESKGKSLEELSRENDNEEVEQCQQAGNARTVPVK